MSKMATCRVLNPTTISFLDYPDPESWAVVVWMVGCDLRCRGCQNEALQIGADGAVEMGVAQLVDIIQHQAQEARTTKVVLTGGDPLSSFNVECTKQLLSHPAMRMYQTCVYTGQTIEAVKKMELVGFEFVKVGPYELLSAQMFEKTDQKMVLASHNQQLFNKHFELLTTDGVYYFSKR
jgi:organic radical activating enzyme